MKTKLLIAALFVALMTMGFDCINDPIIVSLNIDPLTKCYAINPGNNPNFSGTATIDPNDLIDDSYQDKIENARIYDITVQATGTFAGSVTGGVVSINGIPILTYDGSWSDFATEQSLVRGSTHVHKDNRGIQELIRVLTQRPVPTVTLASSGSLTGGGVPPVPAGLGVCVYIYAQIDANIKQ